MNSYRFFLGIMAVACVGIVSFSGCEQVSDVSKAKKKPLPKMDFHKPDSFSAAVGRIREIHDTLVSEDKLPAPITYTVKEVSHSHGDGDAHVHYHLADEHTHDHGDHDHGDHDHGDHDHGDHDHDDHDHGDHDHGDHDHGDHDHGDHDHADPFQPRHRIVVDIFTELNDIAKWLPAIASDGDLPRDSWNASKEVSEKITSHLETVAGSDMPLVQRSNYKSDSSEMEKWIQELESLVEPVASTTENK